MGMSLKGLKKYKKILTSSSLKNNPVLIQILGVCSILAVSSSFATSLIMAASVTVVSALSCFIISILRKIIPNNVRLVIEMLVIASLVIIVDLFIKAFFYDLSKSLSVYVSLIITNCIILGRAEAFAMKNTVVPSFLDGLSTGLGYSMVLIIVGTVRELLGRGSLWGVSIFKLGSDGGRYEPNSFMMLPASVFFIVSKSSKT